MVRHGRLRTRPNVGSISAGIESAVRRTFAASSAVGSGETSCRIADVPMSIATLLRPKPHNGLEHEHLADYDDRLQRLKRGARPASKAHSAP